MTADLLNGEQVMKAVEGSEVLYLTAEMIYQNDSDYLFDSSKFEKTFDFKPTSYAQGIRETVKSMRQEIE
jgi:hypothetical protein